MAIDHAILNCDRQGTSDAQLIKDKASTFNDDHHDIHPQISTDHLEDGRASRYAIHTATVLNR